MVVNVCTKTSGVGWLARTLGHATITVSVASAQVSAVAAARSVPSLSAVTHGGTSAGGRHPGRARAAAAMRVLGGNLITDHAFAIIPAGCRPFAVRVMLTVVVPEVVAALCGFRTRTRPRQPLRCCHGFAPTSYSRKVGGSQPATRTPCSTPPHAIWLLKTAEARGLMLQRGFTAEGRARTPGMALNCFCTALQRVSAASPATQTHLPLPVLQYEPASLSPVLASCVATGDRELWHRVAD